MGLESERLPGAQLKPLERRCCRVLRRNVQWESGLGEIYIFGCGRGGPERQEGKQESGLS